MRGFLRLAIYRLDQTNMIAADQSTPLNFYFTVDGSARSEGIEASLRGNLTERIDVALTYAYTDAGISTTRCTADSACRTSHVMH